MSKFTGPLTITELDAREELWRIEQDLVFYIDYATDSVGNVTKGRQIVVPAGFVSDGASVPSFVERLLPRWGKYRRAAVLHDYLCGLIENGKPHEHVKTRAEADRVFLIAMVAVETPEIDKWCMFLGAKLGTWFPALQRLGVRT